MTQLNHQQLLIYNYIKDELKHNATSPSQEEIANALGIHTHTVNRNLYHMRKIGFLTFSIMDAHSIALTSKRPVATLLETFLDLPQAPKENNHLRERQSEIYEFIANYIDQHQVPPVLREIAKGLDIGTTTVKYHIDQLKEQGFLSYMPGKSRSIRLTNKEMTLDETL